MAPRDRRGKILRPVHPNAGIEAAYRQRLLAFVDAMHRSIMRWVRAQYRSDPPAMAKDAAPPKSVEELIASIIEAAQQSPEGVGRVTLPSGIELVAENKNTPGAPPQFSLRRPGEQAPKRITSIQLQEALQAESIAWGTTAIAAALIPTPAAALQTVIEDLTVRWEQRIDATAPKLAEWFATAVEDRSSKALRKILRDGGFSVKFQPTPAMRDVLAGSIAENVGLIKSIPQQYLGEVQGLVMRSVTAGRDLAYLTKELTKRYGITRRRAELIAKDQNGKATAAMTRVRQTELGVKAIWVHSRAGKEPRPTHVANSGKEYDPIQGWFDPAEQEYIWPGTLINCRCFSKTVVPGFS